MNTKQIAEVIERMLDLLNEPRKWTKGVLAKRGAVVFFDGRVKHATSFCILGAVQRCAENNGQILEVNYYLNRCVDHSQFCSVDRFNDDYRTTYEDMRLFLKTALHALEEEK